MSIIYDPKEILKKAAPESKIKRVVSSKMGFKRAALSFLDGIDFIDKKNLAKVALDTVKGYKKRIRKADKDDRGDLRKDISKDPKQLIQRVQNAVVLQITDSIKKNYSGETYTWLPSDADEPDPEHQLNYGKTFVVGEGEMPGDRIGCRCGMEIHTDDKTLNLD